MIDDDGSERAFDPRVTLRAALDTHGNKLRPDKSTRLLVVVNSSSEFKL